MAIDPNVFYRAGAIKGQLARQAKQDKQQRNNRLIKSIGSISKVISDKKDQYDQNMLDFNGQIPRDTVPEGEMMNLTRHIAREKESYVKNSKILRSSFSRKKKMAAQQEIESIKSGLSNVYADFEKAKNMGIAAEKLIPQAGKNPGLEVKNNMLDFANDQWWQGGIKYSRDGLTINDFKEEQVLDKNGNPLPTPNLVSYDKRLSDVKFAKPVKGTGEALLTSTAEELRKDGFENGVEYDETSLNMKKRQYIQSLKNMPAEEQRHLYFNGLGGFEGSSQAETDVAKSLNMNENDFINLMQPINEDDPNYDNVMRKRQVFERELDVLGTKKDFLTPEMIDSQWSTILNSYNSGLQEYKRKTLTKQEREDEKVQNSQDNRIEMEGIKNANRQALYDKKMKDKENTLTTKEELQASIKTQWEQISKNPKGHGPSDYIEAFRNILGNTEDNIQYGNNFKDESGNLVSKGFYIRKSGKQGGQDINVLINAGEELNFDAAKTYINYTQAIKK